VLLLSLALAEFGGLLLSAPDGALVPGESLVPAAVHTGLSMWANVAVLAGIAAGVRLLAMGLLELAAWRKCV
jgi:hypothetical protein